jgi:hypothetical protein
LSRPSDDIPTTIVVADFSHEIVEAVLRYVYSGEVSVLPEHVEDFLALSEALKIHVDTADIIGMNVPFKPDALAKENLAKNDDYYDVPPMPDKTGDFKSSYEKMDVEVLIKSDTKSKHPKYYGYNGFNGRREKLYDKGIDLKLESESKNSALNLTKHAIFPMSSSSRQRKGTKNDRLVRPIPSLMPIESMSDRKSPHKKSIDLLDLSTLKGNLNCNTNSAFERVKNAQEGNRQSILAAKLQDDPRYGSHPFSYHEPLRLGFASRSPDSTEQTNHTNNEKRNGTRKMPFNKVLDSPWSARKPILYKHKTKSAEPVEVSSQVSRYFDNCNGFGRMPQNFTVNFFF